MNLRQILTELSERLIARFSYTSAEKPVEMIRPTSVWPIKRFMDWLNKTVEARAILAELGVQFPVVEGQYPDTRSRCRARLKEIYIEKMVLDGEASDIAKQHIPDYHFLDYRVSTFWTCDDSPIGMCVFKLNDNCQPTSCRYCGGPTERK